MTPFERIARMQKNEENISSVGQAFKLIECISPEYCPRAQNGAAPCLNYGNDGKGSLLLARSHVYMYSILLLPCKGAVIEPLVLHSSRLISIEQYPNEIPKEIRHSDSECFNQYLTKSKV
jgi:hypothetical protein